MEKLQCQSSFTNHEKEIQKQPLQSEQRNRAQAAADRSLEDMLRVFQDESASERASWAEDHEVLALSKIAPPSSYKKGHAHRNELINKCLTLQAVHQLIGHPKSALAETKLPGNLGQYIEAQREEWARKVNENINNFILSLSRCTPDSTPKKDIETAFFIAAKSYRGLMEPGEQLNGL